MRTDIDVICDRLLDSEEHAVESAIPQVAEDAVNLIRGLEADALRFRKLMALLQSAYNADPAEFDGLTAYCSMLSRAGPVCLDSFYPKISGALRV